MKDSTETGEPGNYGVGFPNFLGKVEDPEARKSKLAAELANGRLAMMAPWLRVSKERLGILFQVPVSAQLDAVPDFAESLAAVSALNSGTAWIGPWS